VATPNGRKKEEEEASLQITLASHTSDAAANPIPNHKLAVRPHFLLTPQIKFPKARH